MSKSNAELFAESDGMKISLDVLRLHKTNKSIVTSACDTFCNVSLGCEKNTIDFIENGGEQLFQELAEIYQDDVNILAYLIAMNLLVVAQKSKAEQPAAPVSV
jgi:hypothetical protein